MVDIETLSVSNNAAIIQIGATKFDEENLVITERMNFNIDAISNERFGFEIDAKTVMWWLAQDPKIIQKIRQDAKPVEHQLKLFRAFYDDCNGLWSHATFDAVILSNAFRRIKSSPPWSFRDVWDLRTLCKLIPREVWKDPYDLPSFNKHDAFDDSYIQTLVLFRCFEYLKKKGINYLWENENRAQLAQKS